MHIIKNLFNIKIKLASLLLFLFSILSGQSFAAFNYKVEGVVKYNGKGIVGVEVLMKYGVEKTKKTTTNSQGEFSLSLDPNEEYNISFYKKGYTQLMIIYSTIGINEEDAKGMKATSNPQLEIFEMPDDTVVKEQLNKIVDNPLLSYYYSPEKKAIISDELYDQSYEEEMDKIRKIVGLASTVEAKEKAKENKYKAAIKKGDDALASKSYVPAKAAYNEALGVKPEEQYPKTKIAEIDDAIAAQAKADALAKAEKDRLAKEKADADAAEKARLAKEKADAAVSAQAEKDRIAKEKADAALSEKERQAKLKADAAAAAQAEKDRIAKAKADAELVAKEKLAKEKADADAAALAEKERQAKIKADADAAERARLAREKMKSDSIQQVKFAKEKAIADAAEKDRLEKAAAIEKARLEKEKADAEIAEKERLAKEAEELKITKKFDAIIHVADSAKDVKNYDLAKAKYNEAMLVKPKESYPKDKISEIDIMLDFAKKAQYTNELAKKYPQGMTEEKSKEGSNQITKRIVVQGNKGTLYIKKETSFGAVYYFKDNVAITEQEWKAETEVKK